MVLYLVLVILALVSMSLLEALAESQLLVQLVARAQQRQHLSQMSESVLPVLQHQLAAGGLVGCRYDQRLPGDKQEMLWWQQAGLCRQTELGFELSYVAEKGGFLACEVTPGQTLTRARLWSLSLLVRRWQLASLRSVTLLLPEIAGRECVIPRGRHFGLQSSWHLRWDSLN